MEAGCISMTVNTVSSMAAARQQGYFTCQRQPIAQWHFKSSNL